MTSTWEPVPFQDPETGNTITVFNKVFNEVIGSSSSTSSTARSSIRTTQASKIDREQAAVEPVAAARVVCGLEGDPGTGDPSTGDIFGIGAIPVDPNNGVNARGPIFWDRTHMFKLSGSYLLGWDILASAKSAGAERTRVHADGHDAEAAS